VRLKQIKLSGFKSFVDPTAFEVPGQRVGVVGPNGCGKSNIIDAVRWVLGESKASELRGESMQDVIFSGSVDRKPASRASVELVFDNSLGRIGGSWGTFAEIAVRRVLTRDGQSTYSINNQVVRRKDVHDLFLGTGLGPRAYAIIGQGSISRIIEARPEDLRVYLEEAAGISRYKERRRETENRLSDTRENLTRVEDIRRELATQIERLVRQAEVARRFRELEADRDRKQRMLWILRRDESQGEQQRQAAEAARAQAALEAALASVRAVEAELESLRAEHYAAGETVHQTQARYYEANAEVARLEGEIRRVLESQGQLGERIASLAERERQALAEREQAQASAEAARVELAEAQGRADELAEQLVALADQTAPLEDELREARGRLDDARALALETRQAIELSAMRERAARASQAESQRRETRLQSELGSVAAPDPQLLAQSREQLAAAELDENDAAQAQREAQAGWQLAEAARGPAQQALRDAEATLTRIDARLTALRQLQERARSQSRIGPWLERHELAAMGRLWQRLRIDDGWESAIEAVLRERVEAIEVSRLQTAASLLADAPPAKVVFYAARSAATTPGAVPGLRALLDVVRVTDPALRGLLADWLHGCAVVDSLEEGLARSVDLQPGQRLVTREGHCIGGGSLHFHAVDSEQEGVLARQQELEHLGREQRAQQLLADEARAGAVRAEALAADAMRALAAARDANERAVRRAAGARLEAQRLEQLDERARASRERIEHDLAEVREALESAAASLEEEQAVFERLDMELAERQEAAEACIVAHEEAQGRQDTHRRSLSDRERAEREAAFAVRELHARIERHEARAADSARQEADSRQERLVQQERLSALSDSAARDALDAALATRVAAEHALTGAREALGQLTQHLRELDEQRIAREREQEPLRARIAEVQLREQAARLSAEQFAEQLLEQQVDEAAVRAAFPQVPRAGWLQAELTRLGQELAALGPVNLAALDELGASEERKGFLDAQSADLESAIGTLEDAIRRIDRETRELLQQTYDAVNRSFGQLFPELFGGGEARLILTGEELLDAGIQVMAQPPGKRNTTIHLLSGGEKALTAIALVFAMFQLNPAPFCLLDEVDAPLDDANTERYCDMVRRMSDQTQFLFITHNRIAMELAQQLVGVTMQERGVSRIVAVDIDSARQMAQAA
jgi:chromosome segregation protein